MWRASSARIAKSAEVELEPIRLGTKASAEGRLADAAPPPLSTTATPPPPQLRIEPSETGTLAEPKVAAAAAAVGASGEMQGRPALALAVGNREPGRRRGMPPRVEL